MKLDDARVSAQHASLRFTAGAWVVRDLASTNGTWLGDRKLSPGESCRLERGAVLAFGFEEERWELVSDAPPTAAILSAEDASLVRETHEGLLSIPDDDAPEAVILRDGSGSWTVEDASGQFPISGGEKLVVGGKTYVFSDGGWPGRETERVAPDSANWSLAQSQLRFIVSRDEEEVELELRQEGRATRLSNRAHFYLLLVLARSRVRDELQAKLPPALSGWCYADEVSRALKISRTTINLLVHRLRRDFAGVGVVDPAAVVERRQRLGELRIGLSASQIDLQGMS